MIRCIALIKMTDFLILIISILASVYSKKISASDEVFTNLTSSSIYRGISSNLSHHVLQPKNGGSAEPGTIFILKSF